jgi:aryl-alcohol dehydrogenase-like predicted oxidoreductase
MKWTGLIGCFMISPASPLPPSNWSEERGARYPSSLMRYRKLGKFGVKVSEVSLGGWLTHGRSIDDDTTAKIVHRAFDLGVNLFDTADVYNRGEAELSLGKVIKDFRREDLVIATKCFFPMSDRPNDRGLGRKHITESVNNSLKRMGVDYIDLYQFHRFDAETPLEETARAIDDMVRQGKVLYWGVSQWEAQQISDLVHISRSVNGNPPSSNQPVYNMLTRGIEASVSPTCAQHGLGQIVFSPLAQGVLTGKYLPGQSAPEGSRGADSNSNNFMQGMLNDETLGRVQKLKAYAEENGQTLSRFALAWCLRRPEISSVIVGATRVEQIEDNVQASGIEFPSEVWERAQAILEGVA